MTTIRIALLFLILASSFQSTGCAGIYEVDGSNCYSFTDQEAHGTALRLELSNEVVCTDVTTKFEYIRLMQERTQQLPGYAYREGARRTELHGKYCNSLASLIGSEHEREGDRQGFVGFSSEHKALVAKSEDPGINSGAKEAPMKLEQLLRLELNSGCEWYRQRKAASAVAETKRKEEQEIQAAQSAKLNAKKEAKRKLEEKRQAEWDRQRQRKIARVCPNGLGGLGDLIFANPYDVKGKCYSFVGSMLQLLSRSTGFYQLNHTDRVYIDFGTNAAPSQFFQGYVKGVGVFSYTTVTGAKMIVPSLVTADLPPENVPASAAD